MSISIPNGIIHDKNEKIVSVLGKNYLQSVMTGSGVQNTSIILTEKRLYQIGKIFVKEGSTIQKWEGKSTVYVDDISATSIITMNNIKLLILAVISTSLIFILPFIFIGFITVAIIPSLILWALYFVTKKKYLIFEYHGGHLLAPCHMYTSSQVDSFMKNISKIKDTNYVNLNT